MPLLRNPDALSLAAVLLLLGGCSGGDARSAGVFFLAGENRGTSG